MSKTKDVMTEADMDNIYVVACNLGLMNGRNQFRLRMNPELIVSLSDNSCRVGGGEYSYGAGAAGLIADSSVGTYKIEKL